MVSRSDELFMLRCFDLAWKGAGYVSPNPMVGAVLVHQNRIIGEGYHAHYGEGHAEVHAINSVPQKQKHLIPNSTLYVSLEPCCFFGKTPACTNLILQHRIPRVVISVLDNSPQVNGKGITILRNAGVEVISGVLEELGKMLLRFRYVLNEQGRPYIILKYAQTRNGFFAPEGGSQFWITNPYSKRLTHKWRHEIDGIIVGNKTIVADDPQLTNRHFPGRSPTRIVIDPKLSLSASHKVFKDSAPTIYVTEKKPDIGVFPSTEFLQMDFSNNFVDNLVRTLYQKYNLAILLVEGGAYTLKQFLKHQVWDEARVFTGEKTLSGGIPAPLIPAPPYREFRIAQDRLTVYFHKC